jgi:hypothetical protein
MFHKVSPLRHFWDKNTPADPSHVLNTSYLSFIALAVLTLPACVESKMRERLEENALAQRGEFKDLLGTSDEGAQAPIAWREAHRRMASENLSLRQSKDQLEQSKKLKRNQWLSLAPNIAAFASLGDSLSALTSLSGSDVNAEVVASLNIPNPFQFYGSLYSAALQRQNAEWSHELDKRRAYIELYSLFMEQERLDESENSLKMRLETGNLMDSEDLSRALTGLRTESQNLTRMRTMHRLRINQALNTPGANWRLKGNLPKISYRERMGKISIGEDFGKLALNLQAIQIEAAILRRQQVAFQQWPTVNFGFSGPPLYSSDGESTDYSGESVSLFSGANKSVDLVDPIGRTSMRDAEQRIKYTRDQLRLRIESETYQMREAHRAYLELLSEEQRLSAKIRDLDRSSSTEPVILLAELEERAQLVTSLGDARRKMRQIDLQVLLWDETFWK